MKLRCGRKGVAMNIAIIYCSQAGHTKRYAEWLAEEFGVEATPFAQVHTVDIAAMDKVIFCSWYHAAGLTKATWLQKQLERYPMDKFVVLGVGATPMPCDEWPESNHEHAFRNKFPEPQYKELIHFYAQGGFEYGKLGSFDKVAMRIYFHMLEKGKDTAQRDLDAVAQMRKGFDGSKREYLDPLIAYIRKCEEQA